MRSAANLFSLSIACGTDNSVGTAVSCGPDISGARRNYLKSALPVAFLLNIQAPEINRT